MVFLVNCNVEEIGLLFTLINQEHMSKGVVAQKQPLTLWQ